MPNIHGELDDGELVAQRYRIVEHIAHGGFGAVYRAVDESKGTPVALKHTLPDLTPEDRRRFAREVRAMRRVQHPHVMPVLDARLDNDPPFFVMPLATTRLDLQLEELRADPAVALAAFRAICAGVTAIHGAGEVHRDLKPSNVLMVNGTWLVSDLGLALFSDRDSTVLTRTGSVLGTEGYLAPEQRVSAGAVDPRADIYALGMILCVLFADVDPALLDDTLLPAWLRPVVLRATARSPGRRYDSIAQLARAVGEAWQSIGMPGTAAPPSWAPAVAQTELYASLRLTCFLQAQRTPAPDPIYSRATHMEWRTGGGPAAIRLSATPRWSRYDFGGERTAPLLEVAIQAADPSSSADSPPVVVERFELQPSGFEVEDVYVIGVQRADGCALLLFDVQHADLEDRPSTEPGMTRRVLLRWDPVQRRAVVVADWRGDPRSVPVWARVP